MQLFNLTLQSAQSITHAIFGHFSSPKAQEILVARGKILELLRPLDDGRVVSVLKTEVFGLIRDLKPFRLPGSSRDFIVIGSDSGKLIVLEYVGATNTFEIIHEEPFGKTGCRRIVPGQLLATDPKGRAVMVAALEKQKFVYTLARSSDNRLTISSPLEAHRSNTVVFATCGVHVAGFDNPVFACIEASYDDNEAADVDANGNLILAKTLVYYELDLGANTVSRLWTTPIDAGASALYSVPGDAKRPGGVLVCSEDVVSYYNRGMESLHVPLPRRFDTGDHKTLLITAGTVCNILKKGVDVLFFLLQSELGDIYKLEFDLAPAPADPDTIIVTDIAISYLDTLPPAAALCLTDTGFLFSASEFGPTSFLRITSFGGRAEEGSVTASATVNGANMIAVATARSQGAMDTAEMDDGRVFFAPRTLTHLELLSETDSLAPLLGLEVGDLAREQAPQIYALSGRGNRSRLSALRYGLPLSERLNVELPGAPTAVFTARARLADSYHSLIALSFADATIVLRGEEDMVEADDTGLLTDCPTLLLTTFNEAGPGGAAVGEGGWLQIHPGGARLVTAATGRVSDWVAPNQRKVTACAANSAQLVIALEGGDLVYLEADHGVLRELETRSLGNDPASLAIGPVPAGRQRSPFLAVGAHEKAVRVLSLEPGAIFAPLTVQGLPEVPTSLAITAADESPAPGAATTAPVTSAQSSALTLYIGLKSGVLVRSTLDSSKGSLSEPRRRVLGTAPVRLHKVIIGAGVAILALSSRAWVFYNYGGVGHEAPLSVVPSAGAVIESAPHIPSLDTVASFATSSFPQGLVCTSGNALRLLSPEALGEAFSKHSLPLRYTPRRLAVYEPNHHKALAGSGRAPAVPLMAIVEADDNTFTWAVKQEMAAAVKQAFETGAAGEAMGDDATADAGAGADETKADGDDGQTDPDEAARLLELQCGPPQAGAGFWGSCIRLVTPAGLQTVQLIEMADNEAALAATVCAMGSGDEAGVFVIVAVAKDLRQTPRRSHSGGSLLTYRLVADSTSITVPAAAEGEEATTKTVATGRLDFVHRTPLTDVCLSLTPFKSERMLLAGVGPLLRLYDMGKRKLLLKSELKVPSASTLTSIHVNDEVAGVEGAASLPPGPARASGSKVTVGDATSGFHTCLYTAESVSTASAVAALGPGGASATGTAVQRRFAVVATSPTPRVMSAAVAVDPLTMAGGDRFGNVFMTRLSPEDADRIDSDPTGGIKMGPLGNPVPRAPVAMTDAAQFHVGDMVTGLTLAALTPGGAKAVVYTTLMGSLGALVPVGYKEDAEFFTHLEMHLRAEVPSLVGRDHLSFRSYHGPVAHVIDGDLCAVYAESARAQSGSASGGAAGGMLTRGQVEQIAGELTCEPRDVVRKIDEIRQRVL